MCLFDLKHTALNFCEACYKICKYLFRKPHKYNKRNVSIMMKKYDVKMFLVL